MAQDKQPERTEIGVYIETLRNKKGLSMRELGNLSGVSHSEISRIESGERVKPTAKILGKLSPHLSISNEKLLAVAGYIPRHEIMAAHDLSSYTNITREMQSMIREEVEKAWEEKNKNNKK